MTGTAFIFSKIDKILILLVSYVYVLLFPIYMQKWIDAKSTNVPIPGDFFEKQMQKKYALQGLCFNCMIVVVIFQLCLVELQTPPILS